MIRCLYKIAGLTSIVMLIAASSTFAQNKEKLVRKGNNLYEEKKYNEAEILYRKSMEKDPAYTKGNFNLGASIYKQNNYTEAAKLYENLSNAQTTPETKANAFHNLGNSYLQDKKYKEAIEAYKNALRVNPSDADTKYNLAYAQKMLKLQQNQQNQQQNKQDQNKQDQNKQNQDKKEQQKQDQQQKQKQQQEQQKQQGQQKQQQKQQLSREDAERMLEALKNNEKKTMEKLKKEEKKAVRINIEKDW